MKFLNNMMGVASPLATGYIVGATGSVVGAFLTAGIVLAVGIIAYVLSWAGSSRSSICPRRDAHGGLSRYGYPVSRSIVEPILGNSKFSGPLG